MKTTINDGYTTFEAENNVFRVIDDEQNTHEEQCKTDFEAFVKAFCQLFFDGEDFFAEQHEDKVLKVRELIDQIMEVVA